MNCTGVSASWCPNCGDCACERSNDGDCCFDGADCPLHSNRLKHAETVELVEVERDISALAREHDVDLCADDHRELSRFAQFLYERSRKEKVARG